MNLYQKRIAEIEPAVDPRHIEGLMRVQYGTLDHLSAEEFKREVHLCAERGLEDPESLNGMQRATDFKRRGNRSGPIRDCQIHARNSEDYRGRAQGRRAG